MSPWVDVEKGAERIGGDYVFSRKPSPAFLAVDDWSAEAVEADGLLGADTSTPAVEVIYGRIVLINTANEDNQVLLRLGTTIGDVQLTRGATLAVTEISPRAPARISSMAVASSPL